VLKHWYLDGAALKGNTQCPVSDPALDSNATRSAFTSGSAGVLLSTELQLDIETGWAQAGDRRARHNIYDQLHDRYRCLYCDAVIAETGRYLSHLERHDVDLPHACQEPGCVKRFREHHELRHHTELHYVLLQSYAIRGQPRQAEMHRTHKRTVGLEYGRSVENLIRILEALARVRRQHRAVKEAQMRASFITHREKHLRLQATALCTIELLTREKVDAAWLKMLSERWQMIREDRLQRTFLTSGEIAELESSTEARRARLSHPVDEDEDRAAELRDVKALKRKASCPARLEQNFGLYS